MQKRCPNKGKRLACEQAELSVTERTILQAVAAPPEQPQGADCGQDLVVLEAVVHG